MTNGSLTLTFLQTSELQPATTEITVLQETVPRFVTTPLTLAFSLFFIVFRSALAVDCCIYSFLPGEVCYQDTTNGPKILSTGFGDISFDHHDEILDASMEATMEAKSQISIFLNHYHLTLNPYLWTN